MKYRCVIPFAVDKYDESGFNTNGCFEIECGSIWECDDETNVIGGEVHLDNTETMEWLEIPEKDLEEYFEPLT